MIKLFLFFICCLDLICVLESYQNSQQISATKIQKKNEITLGSSLKKIPDFTIKPKQSRRNLLKSLGTGLTSILAVSTVHATKANAKSNIKTNLAESLKIKGCPSYEEFKADSAAQFDVDKYQGLWYEQAFHDWTQTPVCGCTRFNMTRRGNTMEDAFTTSCPGDSTSASTFLVNMAMDIDPMRPGIMVEHALYYDFPNMVLDLWRDTDGNYLKSIQMQCVEVAGQVAFVGINFLTRDPIISPSELQEMFDHATTLGLPYYGGSRVGMSIVKQQDCMYPSSTDTSEVATRTRFNIGGPQGATVLLPELITSRR